MNTVKVLHTTTTAQEYEALYLFWLGIELDTSHLKQQLLQRKKLEQNLHSRLKKESTLSQVSQSLIVIENEIGELEQKRGNFNLNEDYEKDIQNFTYIKSAISRNSTTLSRCRLRTSLIRESLEELASESSKLSVSRIRDLYENAQVLMPTLQKSFEDLLQFHNGMIDSKKRYIESELPEIETETDSLENELALLRQSEAELNQKLNTTDSMAEFEAIIKKLTAAYENKGMLEEQKRLWETSLEKLAQNNSELDSIDNDISSMDHKIQSRVSEFNKYFSKLSEDLYGEKYVLSADNSEKGYQLNISSIISNPGTGKKKAEMAAFDLAYIEFADSLDIECLHFVLQDQIENIHDNQINKILTGYVEDHNCQYVLPVLRDKLPSELATKDFEILSLSQSRKLFKI